MSLKTFHLLFVATTTLLCVFVAVWGLNFATPSIADFAQKLGIAGIVGALIMPVYGVYFYGKIKKLSSDLES